MIDIDTTLAQDAQLRSTTAGEAILTLLVQLPAGPRGKAVQAHATKGYGAGGSAWMVASRRAAELKRGVRVRLRCAGMDLHRGHLQLSPLLELHTPDLQPQHSVLPKED